MSLLYADWSIDSLITNATVSPEVLVRADLIVRNDHVWDNDRTKLYPIFTYIPRKFLDFWPPNFTDNNSFKNATQDDTTPKGQFLWFLKTHQFTFVM